MRESFCQASGTISMIASETDLQGNKVHEHVRIALAIMFREVT